MQYKDYYRTLDVGREATPAEIKRAYRRLAHKYHPDVSKAADAEERFKELNEAYEVLKDPEKRAAYDQLGMNWKAGQGFNPPPGWDAGFEFSGSGFSGGNARSFSEFFESLFGAGSPFGAGRPNAVHGRGGGFAARGEDHHARIVINLEDSYEGRMRNVRLQAPVPDGGGGARLQQRALNVQVPRGIGQGQRIKLAGQGGPGLAGGPAGDLYLEVVFEPHPRFRSEGRDIYTTLPVAPWEAALGGRVPVPTLGGTVELTLPAGVKSGQKLRLAGRGLPGQPPGDQFAVVSIVTPAATDEGARTFYRRMGKTFANFDPRRDAVV